MSESAELVYERRNGLIDVIHYGSAVVTDLEGHVLYAVGNPDKKAFMRSSAKPLQVIPTVESGALEKYQLNDVELAVMCASHPGWDIHVAAVHSILNKIELTEAALKCNKENAIWDNCSGKHSGMLTGCRFYGAPVDTYLSPDNPVQVRIREVIAELSGLDQVCYGIDGCGVPTFYLPLRNMARAFARLANPEGLSDPRKSALKRIVQAMKTHPEMTGEFRQGHTWPREIVAKSGALGCYCGGVIGQGQGIAVKIDDGNGQVAGLVFAELIRRLGLADRHVLDVYDRLQSRLIVNRRGETVGAMEVAF